MQPQEQETQNSLLPGTKYSDNLSGSEPTGLDIQAGMKNREFFFHFQPIFELQSGKQVGSEMLIRWARHGEVLLPARFFPAMERNSLLKTLDQYVIQQVNTLDWDHILHPDFKFRVFINVSSESVADPGFLLNRQAVVERMKDLVLTPVIELSERSQLDANLLIDHLADLRQNGLEVALDDFGVGYSSLARLVSLPLDIIKIDRHFTSIIGQSSRGEAVLESVLSLTRKIGLITVVEGVETNLQADWLRQQTPCWVQGYLFGYPVPMDFRNPDRYESQPSA